MPPTRLSGREIKDESIQRADLDVTSPGQSVITRVLNSSDISLSSTGFDPGTGDVTIGLTDTGITPGQYTKVTFDAKGRATAGTSLAISDLPTSGVTVGTWTKVTVNAQGLVTVGADLAASDIPAGSTYYVQNQSAAPQTASLWITGVASATALRAYDGTGTYYVGIAPPAGLAASYTFKLPASYGVNNQVLAGDGVGGLSWTTLPSALPPNGSASGDLSSTYPAPTVTGLRGSVLPALGASALLRYDGSAWVFDANVYLTGNQIVTLSGDVSGSGATSITATIGTGAVTLAKMANLDANSFIGNNTGAPATPIALTVAQAKTLLAIATADITNIGSWPGSTSLVTLGTVTTGTWSAAEIAAVHGGTGQTVYTVGDILYADTTTTLARRAGVATGNALISGGVGVAVTYGKIGLTTHISGVLPVANGGTGLSALGTVGTAALAFTSASSGLLAWSGSAMSVDTKAYLPLTAGATYPLSGNLFIGGVPTYVTAAPLNMVNSAAGALRTQMNLVNTGGGAGAGSAIDFYTYDVTGVTTPGLRIAGLDNNYSADFVVYTKVPGAAGNALAERFRVAADGRATFTSDLVITNGIVGVTTGASVSAGHVGELVEAKVTVGSATALTSTVAKNVMSISLTAGDWDVEAHVNVVKSVTGGIMSALTAGISTFSTTMPTDGTECEGALVPQWLASWRTGATCPRKRINVTSTTTVYLVARATFDTAALSAYGMLSARRVR